MRTATESRGTSGHPLLGPCSALLVLAALALGGCGGASEALTSAARGGASLSATIRSSRDLGPLGGDVRMRLALALAGRHDRELDGLIGAGRRLSPSAYARRYLPRAAAVQAAVHQLEPDGLSASWTPGSPVLTVSGPATAVDRAFAVRIERYRTPGGATFYAPATRPRLRGPLRQLVKGVSGLDSYNRLVNLGAGASSDPSPAGCGQSVGGYSPAQVLGAYDFASLKTSGLGGAGQTVVFIEIDKFAAPDLACFAEHYGLPPFNVAVAPSQLGPPNESSHAEPDLDLEVVHSIAPAAHLVVYYSDARVADLAATAAAAMKAYPRAIFSISIGGCEVENVNASGHALLSGDQTVWRDALRGLAATGGSAFVASGDSGAYTCGSRLTSDATGAEAPSVSDPASDPYATSVGGTTLFVAPTGTYGGEAAWGGPFEQDGSGGGVSQVWTEPFYQRNAALENRFSDGMRQVPDVSALGDANTGWNIFHDGGWDVVAGTSAAAPLWAGLVALIDQSLDQRRLARVGFANPALYSFGQHASAQPARPFNDVSRGNNLYYPATPGWDFATGWGTPNASGLAADFIAYARSRG